MNSFACLCCSGRLCCWTNPICSPRCKASYQLGCIEAGMCLAAKACGIGSPLVSKQFWNTNGALCSLAATSSVRHVRQVHLPCPRRRVVRKMGRTSAAFSRRVLASGPNRGTQRCRPDPMAVRTCLRNWNQDSSASRSFLRHERGVLGQITDSLLVAVSGDVPAVSGRIENGESGSGSV